MGLTNEQIEKAFDELGCGMALDYGDDEHLIITQDTLDDFRTANRGYSEPGRIVELHAGEYPALKIERAQVRKGDQRLSLYVIDFGDARRAFRVEP